MSDIAQILDNNGFKYYKHPKYSDSYIVKNLEVVYFEPMITYINVNLKYFIVSINFKNGVPLETNFGLDFDVDGYRRWGRYIIKEFSNENDLINELYRMNTFGSNIKG